MKLFIAFSFFLVITYTSYCQSKDKIWNGKKCAVVLTYDDALNVHLSNAIPVLDSHGLKATFYLSDYFGGFHAQLDGWRKAAANGHELGNHTIYHPCDGSLPGREFARGEYELNRYTVRRLTDEIKTMNTLLKAIDGKSERTFAFPCNDSKLHDTAYINGLKNHFVGARAVRSEMTTIEGSSLYDLPSYTVNGQSGEELIALVKKARAENKMLVFLFHGVGGEHSLDVSLAAHRQLLQFLQAQEDVWVPTMVEAAQFIKTRQGNNGHIKSN